MARTKVEFVGTWFADCVYTPTERLSFALGMSNMIIWLVAQIPQLILNYQTGAVESLSVGLLVPWLLGDVCNLLGAYLTDQLSTQKYTAVYFCLMDFVILLQYIYYIRRQQNGNEAQPLLPQHHNQPKQQQQGGVVNYALAVPLSVAGLMMYAALSTTTSSPSSMTSYGVAVTEASPRVGRVLMGLASSVVGDVADGTVVASAVAAAAGPRICNAQPDIAQSIVILGSILSWLSGFLYTGSRFPQIYHNWKNHREGKSIDGLSMQMFALAFLANVCYGFSVLLRVPTVDTHFFMSTLPFLIGSMGPLLLDPIILLQGYCYKEPHEHHDGAVMHH